MSAPIKIAVVPEPGIPSVNNGIIAPPEAALLAVSGPATPAIAPVPNLPGFFEIRFSIRYEKKEARVAPAPGRIPTKKPKSDPLAIGPADSLNSSLEGIKLLIFAISPSSSSFSKIVLNTSPRANRPTAIVRNSTP
ncbi:Uncharacterised protein [Chlamydia trachomatis]|nr:Uncharacterised protein [Chlamydia trachomatis]